MMIFLFCARDIFARDIEKMPVKIIQKIPVTSKKFPLKISKIEYHDLKKISRVKKNCSITGISQEKPMGVGVFFGLFRQG